MRPQSYIAAVAVALAAAVPAIGEVPTKQPTANAASVRVVVKPGEVVRWRSPNIGQVRQLTLIIGGRGAAYGVEPRTNACVAYGYQSGVAVRLTDCRHGRRVPFVRVRAVSAALKPVVVRLRLN